jgi:hypothetical protein
VIPAMTVLVHHPRGASVQLAACDWCVQAIRRLAAVTGGQAVFEISEAAGPPPSALRAAPRGPRPASPPVLIAELTQEVQDATGLRYIVRVYGRERTDHTWEGWLEFVAVGAAVLRRTGVDTNRSSRADLAYWATGLGDAFLQGGFVGAQQDGSTTSPGT